MNLAKWDITPCLMVKNEDYWIYYVLSDIYKIFQRIIILDTGSTDNTKNIIKEYYPKVELLEEDYGTDSLRIGNGRNILRDMVRTKWMFLIDGDEIWRESQLLKLLLQDIPLGKDVVMAGNWNIEDVNNELKLRTHDRAGKDVLFSPEISWHRVEYPFETYGLDESLAMDRVHYIDAGEVFAWHVRTTIRSSKDSEAYFRKEKYGYFPYDKGYQELPTNWLGEINIEIVNHYLNKEKAPV